MGPCSPILRVSKRFDLRFLAEKFRQTQLVVLKKRTDLRMSADHGMLSLEVIRGVNTDTKVHRRHSVELHFGKRVVLNLDHWLLLNLNYRVLCSDIMNQSCIEAFRMVFCINCYMATLFILLYNFIF